MTKSSTYPPRLAARLAAPLLAGVLVVLALRARGESTVLLVAGSILMFACCWASAVHLLGARAAARFVLAALVIGWTAEELGATRGWFFGHYKYTDVLSPRLGSVPAVIPLMWFALTYTAYVLGNLLVWQSPRDDGAGRTNLPQHALMAFVGAAIVTCYDLGADPYMVYRLRAWIMARTDGDWFGETVQGFAGWMVVSFCILLAFRLGGPAARTASTLSVRPRHTLVPVLLYAGLMSYQVLLGYPVETRTVALFAMGFPLLAACCGLARWRRDLAASSTPAIAPVHAAAVLKEAA